MPRVAPACALAAALALLAGCSGPDDRGTVSGEVTIDGKPLSGGLIRFEPTDGKSPAADAPITDGKYTASVPLGEVKVLIRASKVVGQHKMIPTAESKTVDEVVELVDPRFNDRTELKMTVQRGTQEKNFQVTSRK
jgi:hypothetical protein